MVLTQDGWAGPARGHADGYFGDCSAALEVLPDEVARDVRWSVTHGLGLTHQNDADTVQRRCRIATVSRVTPEICNRRCARTTKR